ncbi:MAG: hypothetical protein EHM93_09935 [Bacteroidales bacterium]|nr:MAG: hypothetical protein EHM93_09935 [Bacteroidales bacterium]
MRKAGIIVLLLFVFVATSNAQSPLAKGSKQINAGVGFSGWGVPIYVGMDFGVYKDITVGFEASFRSYNQKFVGENYRSTIFGFSGNGNYHFNSLLEIPNQWDVYAGLNLGYYIWTTSSNYPGDGASGLGLGAQVGARYFFKNNFGVNLEFGGGNAFSGGKFGITYIF